MPSTLARLFAYAKSSKSEALDNFTTEALASAIRDDFRPFVPVLVDAGLLRYDEEPRTVGVETQVAVTGAGIVDLDLVLEGEGWLAEVWIEVKVFAGESAEQLLVRNSSASEGFCSSMRRRSRAWLTSPPPSHLSEAYCWRIKRGQVVPHPMWWERLRALSSGRSPLDLA
ncbi:MAG: hypothetical protein ACYDAN_12995 [Candidatus Limnocylindrales bacterium]